MSKYFLLFCALCLNLNFLHPSTSTEASFAQNISSNLFMNQNKFYIGAADANGDNSISSIELKRVDGNLQATFVGKALAKGVTVNGSPYQSSSMNNQKIDNLAAQKNANNKTYLVATHHVSNEEDASLNSIALIDASAKTEFTNTNKVNDAAGTELKNNDYAALSASADTIFVAVPPSAGNFGAENSGIVRLKKALLDKDGIKIQRLGGVMVAGDDEKAYKISLDSIKSESIKNDSVNFATHSTGNPIKFSLGNVADMWWDSKLNRLYLALANATTQATSPAAGACSLLVGYIDNDQLFLRTVIPLSLVQQPGINSIIYYATPNPSQKAVSTFKVRTMHTSTGKDYVIVVGDVSDAGTDETRNKYLNTQVNVYALPLAMKTPTFSLLTSGMIASKKNDGTGNIDFNIPVSESKYLVNKIVPLDKDKLTVGVFFQYLVHSSTDAALVDAAITDMQILGDTVLVSLAGQRGAPGGDTSGEAGFFASTAIFSTDGSIRAWTPWSRTACSASNTDSGVVTDKIFGFGFDKNTSNVWYTTKDTKKGTVTLWGAGANNLHGAEGGVLSKILQPFFNDDYGIINLINFDDETPGFLSWDPSSEYPAFSMMVATGNNKIALIQTGVRDTNGVFQPTTAYSKETDPQNVFEFDNVGTKIGTISCAEVSRSTAGNCGWLFIGGNNGLAVIRSNDDGSGWTDLTELSKLDFPWSGYSFKILTDINGNRFTDIIKLIANGTYLYAITQKTIYSIKMNADDFYVGKISDSNLKSVSIPASLGSIFDAILIDNSATTNLAFALATENGVQIATWNNDRLNLSFAQDTQSIPQNFISGPAIKFNFISTQRGGKLDNNKANGNLYVTVFDQDLLNLYVYRFNVQPGSDQNGTVKLTLFDEPYKETGFTQKYFYKIANFEKLERKLYLKQILDQNLRMHNFTNSLAITPDPEKFLPDSLGTYNAIDLGIKTNKIPLFGTLVQDTASGTQYIAGSFGLAANE